jgi:hypothetical protein
LAAGGALSIPNTGHDLRIPCGTIAIEEHLEEAGETCDPFDIDARLRIEWPSLAGQLRAIATQ